MSYKLFVFRHAETFDDRRGIFSGWRDSDLTSKGIAQAQKIAEHTKWKGVLVSRQIKLTTDLLNLLKKYC
jgi:broad specificity phosphatase PhoE